MPVDVDVLIIGAGLSGIGVAWHLQHDQPQRSYLILEARASSGGTWDLFRYPGVRSDSDLSTFSYEFRPWVGEKAIADGPDILRYIRDTAAEAGIDRHVRYHHRVVRACWSSEAATWTVDVDRADTGERLQLTCSWLFSAAGYYRYDEGYLPHFDGVERFRGPVVHPQHWPEDLDYAGQHVVVIGSGATAVTLVPALAERAAHVTMVQRSPTYVMPVPSRDRVAAVLRRRLGPERAHRLTRRKNIAQQRLFYDLCQKRPAVARWLIRKTQERFLPDGYDIDTHLTPRYDPWDERLCAVPDADLFHVLADGRASIVTDRIVTFDETGLQLASGRHLDADVIVTATGLNLLVFGGIELVVDGRPVSWPETIAFKGMLLSGVPNFAYAIGYTNSSWTLKVDLVAEHLCRLLAEMDLRGADYCVPEPPPGMATRPLLDFHAGYVQRSVDALPRKGAVQPWGVNMSYAKDVTLLRSGPVTDPHLRLGRRVGRRSA